MILAETLKCTVPSPNAVKDAVISCVTNPTNATDISTSIASWATAGFTFLLAVFAYFAWQSSMKQLSQMRADAEKTEENARLERSAAEERSRNEIEAAEKRSRNEILESHNLESRRELDSALFGYLSAHTDLITASMDPESSLATVQAEVRKASMRLIMIYAFPGRSGEITKFDDLMMLVAEKRRLYLKGMPNSPETARLSSVMQAGFNVVDNSLRDLYQQRIEAWQFREILMESHRSILGDIWPLLDRKYVKMSVEHNWIEEQSEMYLNDYR